MSEAHDGKFLQDLIRLVRMASTMQAQTCFKSPAAAIRELETPPALGAYRWLALIIIQSPELQLQFRVHFSEEHARLLVERGLEGSGPSVDAATVIDGMREFCNMTGGSIKRGLMGIFGDEIQIGVPEAVKHEVIVGSEGRGSEIKQDDMWCLTFGDAELVCAVGARAQNWSNLAGISQLDASALSSILVSDEGTIEFL